MIKLENEKNFVSFKMGQKPEDGFSITKGKISAGRISTEIVQVVDPRKNLTVADEVAIAAYKMINQRLKKDFKVVKGQEDLDTLAFAAKTADEKRGTSDAKKVKLAEKIAKMEAKVLDAQHKLALMMNALHTMNVAAPAEAPAKAEKPKKSKK